MQEQSQQQTATERASAQPMGQEQSPQQGAIDFGTAISRHVTKIHESHGTLGRVQIVAKREEGSRSSRLGIMSQIGHAEIEHKIGAPRSSKPLDTKSLSIPQFDISQFLDVSELSGQC